MFKGNDSELSRALDCLAYCARVDGALHRAVVGQDSAKVEKLLRPAGAVGAAAERVSKAGGDVTALLCASIPALHKAHVTGTFITEPDVANLRATSLTALMASRVADRAARAVKGIPETPGRGEPPALSESVAVQAASLAEPVAEPIALEPERVGEPVAKLTRAQKKAARQARKQAEIDAQIALAE